MLAPGTGAAGNGTADCPNSVVPLLGTWRLAPNTVEGGLVARGTVSASIGTSENSGSIYSTWLRSIEITIPAGPGIASSMTFAANGSTLDLPTGGKIAFSGSARRPHNPLFSTSEQPFDEAVSPVGPGKLLRGQQARLFARFEHQLIVSTPPIVSHINAQVIDHVVKIAQSGTPDGSNGRYPLSPGLNVPVTAVSALGTTVQLIIDRVDLFGEVAVIDLAFNNDALGCPFTPGAPKGTGAVDILVTAAGASEFTITLPLKDTVCAASTDPQLIHVGPLGAENVAKSIDRSNCSITGKTKTASPFYLIVPSGSDASAPITVVDSSYSVRDPAGLPIVSPTMALPFAGVDAAGPVALTEYRLAGEAFKSLAAPLGGGTGLRTVEVRSRDHSGNLEVARSTQVHVDADSPSVVLAPPAPFTNNPTPSFRATFSDSLAALDISALTFSVDGATVPD